MLSVRPDASIHALQAHSACTGRSKMYQRVNTNGQESLFSRVKERVVYFMQQNQKMVLGFLIICSFFFSMHHSVYAASPEKKEKKRSKQKEKKEQRKSEQTERKEMSKVKKEEREITRKERRKLIKKWKERRRAIVQEQSHAGKYADLYHVPLWPIQAWFFEEKNAAQFSFNYQQADRSFSDSGARHDLADLVFGTTTFKLRDILLTSALLKDGILASTLPNNDDQFLNYLADTEFEIHALQEKMEGSLDLIRYLIKGDWVIGAHIPILQQHHGVRLTSKLPEGVLNNMTKTTMNPDESDGTPFRVTYGGSFERFLKDLMSQKEMELRRGKNVFGLGDIQVFSSVQFESSIFEQLIAGLIVTIPTGRERSTKKLWAPELGEGFWRIGAFGSAVWTLDYFANPHLFFQINFTIPDTVDRRIPQIKQFDGKTQNDDPISRFTADGTDIKDLLLFAEEENGAAFKKDNPFSQPDARIREFSDKAVRTRLDKGVELWVRLGNIFERFIVRRGFLDVFYDLMIKDRDKVRGKVKKQGFDTRLIVQDTIHI